MTTDTPEEGAAQPQPEPEPELDEIDLDKKGAARSEVKKQKTFTFGGKKFTLPKELPYPLVRLLSDMADAPGLSFSEPLDEALEQLLGKDQLAKFMKLKPSANDVGDLMDGVLVMYGLISGEQLASLTS